MARATDHGAPGSYFSLTGGTPVCASDGVRLGEVRQVLGDFESDVFDGLVGEGRPIEPPPGRLVRLWRRLRGRR